MTSTTKNNYLRKYLVKSLLVFMVIAIVYLYIDYRGPEKISLKNDIAFGIPCLKASDLVVQEFDKNDNLWATRGMIIYKLKKGEDKFFRIAHVPTGFSIYWLRNFSLVRRLTIRPECVEMTTSGTGDIYALSAGKIWLLHANNKVFHETFELSNYGFGDQGIRNDGIINIDDSTSFLGEYFQNPNRNLVRLYKSIKNMSSWEVAYQFQPGQIRHIHSVQKDPYTGKLWVCTGDDNKESMIAWSNDKFKTIQRIGQGSQIWRVCQLIFTEEDVIWGTDTDSEDDAGIYRWDKGTAELTKLQKIDGAIFFGTRLKNGTIVMSSNRQGLSIEKDSKTRLYIISEENKITTIEFGTWDHKKPGFWFKYSMLRFQRNQGSSSLAISCLNQKEFMDSELVIISEEILQSTLKTSLAFPNN